MATILLDTLRSDLSAQYVYCADEPVDQTPNIAEKCELLKPDVCDGAFTAYMEFTIEEYLALLDACLEATAEPEVEINATTKSSITFPGVRIEEGMNLGAEQIYDSCGNCEFGDCDNFCYYLTIALQYREVFPEIQTGPVPSLVFDSWTDTISYMPTDSCYLQLGLYAYLSESEDFAIPVYANGACDAYNGESASGFTNLEDCSCSDEDLVYGFQGTVSSTYCYLGVYFSLSSIFLDTATWEEASTVYVQNYVTVNGKMSYSLGTPWQTYDVIAAYFYDWSTADVGDMPYLTPMQDGSATITILHSGGEVVKTREMSYAWYPDETALGWSAVDPAFAGAVSPGSPFVSDITASITII